jgi:hypothetical protein
MAKWWQRLAQALSKIGNDVTVSLPHVAVAVVGAALGYIIGGAAGGMLFPSLPGMPGVFLVGGPVGMIVGVCLSGRWWRRRN